MSHRYFRWATLSRADSSYTRKTPPRVSTTLLPDQENPMKNTLRKVIASVVTLMSAEGLALTLANPASSRGTPVPSRWKTPDSAQLHAG